MEVLRDLFARRDDVAHVGVFGLAQRRGDADVDGVEVADDREIGRGTQFAAGHQGRERGRRNVADVGIAGVEARDLGLADVDARDVIAGFGIFDRERKSYITKPDDADAGGLRADLFSQRFGGRRRQCIGQGCAIHELFDFPIVENTIRDELGGTGETGGAGVDTDHQRAGGSQDGDRTFGESARDRGKGSARRIRYPSCWFHPRRAPRSERRSCGDPLCR